MDIEAILFNVLDHGLGPEARTPLCDIMSRHGSDKGRFAHNYTRVYDALLAPRRGTAVRLFEVGLGSLDPRYPNSMGFARALDAGYRPGASLRGWREYFGPSSTIHGADVDRTIQLSGEVTSHWVDQTDPASILALWEKPELAANLDVIIDDGFHTFHANRTLFEGAAARLSPDGIYFIEDIKASEFPLFDAWAEELQRDWFVRLVELPPPAWSYWNVIDNNLMVITHKTS
jgi:hypothetical protein